MSLAEETEAGSSEYRDRLLGIAEERGGDDRARAFAARLRPPAAPTDGHLGRAPRGRGARRLRLRRRARRASRSRCARSTRPSSDDGYEPLGSVLETNTDDWPFLVDT